jgi:hypothetical protein
VVLEIGLSRCWMNAYLQVRHPFLEFGSFLGTFTSRASWSAMAGEEEAGNCELLLSEGTGLAASGLQLTALIPLTITSGHNVFHG